MKTMWKKAVGIICAGGLSVLCLTGCGKDAAGRPKMATQEIQQNNVDGVQANNNVVDDGEQANNNAADEPLADKDNDERLENEANSDGTEDKTDDKTEDRTENHSEAGLFFDGADLEGSVVEFSETGFSLSPANVETEAGGGQVMAQAAPGFESDENNIRITYTDNTVFQIVNFSLSSQTEVSREDTDKESVKKQSSVCVFGSCQDSRRWTADKILIFKWQ